MLPTAGHNQRPKILCTAKPVKRAAAIRSNADGHAGFDTAAMLTSTESSKIAAQNAAGSEAGLLAAAALVGGLRWPASLRGRCAAAVGSVGSSRRAFHAAQP